MFKENKMAALSQFTKHEISISRFKKKMETMFLGVT